MRSLVTVAMAWLWIVASPMSLNCQEAAPELKADADDSVELRALADKCKDIKTLHAVLLCSEKQLKQGEEGGPAELEFVVNVWYDREKGFLRSQAVDADDGLITDNLVNESGRTTWTTDARARRIIRHSVSLDSDEHVAPRKDRLAPNLRMCGFLLDSVLGYGGIIKTFKVWSATPHDPEVRNAKWFSLVLRRGVGLYGTRGREMRFFMAVDEETGLMAAWVIQDRRREVRVLTASLETDLELDGAVFKVPPAVRKILDEQAKAAESAESTED